MGMIRDDDKQRNRGRRGDIFWRGGRIEGHHRMWTQRWEEFDDYTTVLGDEDNVLLGAFIDKYHL